MLAAPHRRSDRRLGSHNRRSAKLAAGCLYWPWSTDTKYPATVRRQSAAYRVPHKGLRVFIMCPCVIERTQLDSRQIALREGGLRQAQVAVGLPGNDRRARSREGARPRITYRARATVAQPRAALRGKADRGRPPRRATERPGSGGDRREAGHQDLPTPLILGSRRGSDGERALPNVGGYTSALRSTPPISARASRAPRPIAEGWVKLWIYPG
jgi:hypothetical protein